MAGDDRLCASRTAGLSEDIARELHELIEASGPVIQHLAAAPAWRHLLADWHGRTGFMARGGVRIVKKQ